MSNISTNLSEYEAIAKTVQHYIDGAKAGRGAEMKPGFHQDATIFGYADGELFAGLSNSSLAKWTTMPQPHGGLHARIVGIDIVDTIAGVRLELDDWNGHRYTDLFTLLKVDGAWKIMNNVFHQHH
jgi:Putative lumazine-binding